MNIDIASIDMVSEVNMVSSAGEEGGRPGRGRGCHPAGQGRPFPVPPFAPSRGGRAERDAEAGPLRLKTFISPETRLSPFPHSPLAAGGRPRGCAWPGRARGCRVLPPPPPPPLLLLSFPSRARPVGAGWGSPGPPAPAAASQPAGCGAGRRRRPAGFPRAVGVAEGRGCRLPPLLERFRSKNPKPNPACRWINSDACERVNYRGASRAGAIARGLWRSCNFAS